MSEGVITLRKFTDVLNFKSVPTLTAVCFGALADPQTRNYLGAFAQVHALLGEAAKAGFAAIDVDDTDEDLATPFKLRAMPTTVFYREGRETARVEGCDVEKLRRTMAEHMPQDPAELERAVIKKYSETDAAKLVKDEFSVVNAHYGDLNSGKVKDVTDKVRELFKEGDEITAGKKELDIEDFDSGNANEDKLRVEIQIRGTGKTFTLKPGKTLHKLQINNCANNHAGITGFSSGRGAALDDNGNADDAFDGVGGPANPYAGAPPRIPCGG